MASQTGKIYNFACYEPDDTAGAVSITKMEVKSFTYDDAVVVADATVVTAAALDPRDNIKHDGWLVSFRLLTGSTAVTTSKTLAQLETSCYNAIKAAYSSEIT